MGVGFFHHNNHPMTTIESFSEPLALFLEVLLEYPQTYRVVPDNFRGLKVEDAKSYDPLPSSARISNSSLPELSRWGNSASGNAQPHAGGRVVVERPSSPPTEAPKPPKRRTSLDSEDERDEHSSDDEDIEESISEDCGDSVCPSSSSCSSESSTRTTWKAKFAALHHTVTMLAELERTQSLKDIQSPPKAPQRQSSLRFDRDAVTTNISLPDEGTGRENTNIQSVAKRRYGVSLLAGMDPLSTLLAHTSSMEEPMLVLEKIDSEVCLRDEETLHEGPMLSTTTRPKQDSSPSCARRRPSPQLDLLTRRHSPQLDILAFGLASCGMESASKTPSSSKRRPSPRLEKTATDCSSLGSPVRAKRRPSPEYETFGNLLHALVEAQTIVEEVPSLDQ